MFVFRLTASVLANALIFAVPLFAIAGTLAWWRAWVIVALTIIGSVWAVSSLPRDLLEERLKPPMQEGQPALDRLLLVLLLVSYFGLLVLIPLDVFHWHIISKPSQIVSSFGLGLFIVGWWIAYLALRENAFAAPVVKLQEDRHQSVIASGVYSVVRHPMYAGGLLLMIGLPLWLESYVGGMFALAPIATLAARIGLEERILKRGLSGYEDYTLRVRYRLVPFLW